MISVWPMSAYVTEGTSLVIAPVATDGDKADTSRVCPPTEVENTLVRANDSMGKCQSWVRAQVRATRTDKRIHTNNL